MTQFQLRSFAGNDVAQNMFFMLETPHLSPQLRSEFCISFAKWMLEMSCVPARLVRAGPHFCSFEKDVPNCRFWQETLVVLLWFMYHFKGTLFVGCAKACQFGASGYDFGVRWSDSLSDLRADVLSLLLIASQFVTTSAM